MLSLATLYRFFAVATVLMIAEHPALAQSELELDVAHFSSLDLFAVGETGVSNNRALSKAIQELNRLRDEHAPIKFAIVTGTLGVQQIFQGNTATAPGCGASPTIMVNAKPKLVDAAKNLSTLIRYSKIPSWLFLPGRGDRLSGCHDELAAFHELLAEARRQSAAMGGPDIIDLSQQPSFTVDRLVVLGMDSSDFGRGQRTNSVNLAELRTAFRAFPDKRVLVAVSWPRSGDPLPTVTVNPGTASHPGNDWILTAEEQRDWSDVIRSDRVLLVVAGEWQPLDPTTYSDFHGLFPPDLSSADITKLYVAPPLGWNNRATAESAPRGFEILRVGSAGKVSRTMYWLAADAFHADPSSEFRLRLRIGEAYERAGRLAEAQAAYRRALELKNVSERELALRNFNRVLNQWGFMELWVQNRLRLAFFMLVLILLACVYLVWRFWGHKRRLRIYPLDAPADANVPPAHLLGVTEYLVGRMRFFSDKTGPIDLTKLPYVWPGVSEGLGSTLERLIPGSGGALASWLVGWLFRPDIELRGTLATSDSESHIVLNLNRRGDHIRSWERSVPRADTHDALKDLVYDVLLHIKHEPG